MPLASLILVGSLVSSVPVHLAGDALIALEPAATTEYEVALSELDEANTAVNNDPEANLGRLADALETMSAYPRQLANHNDGTRLVELATLNLARALLRADDRAGATEVMDDLLRRSPDKKLPIQRFGPTLAEFHDARVSTLAEGGTAELQFKCELSCQVLLDRRTITSRSGPLYLGTYSVEILSEDGSLPPERQEVTLDEPGMVLMLRYPMAGLEPTDDEPPPVISPPRLAPRWAEVLLSVIGAGVVGAAGAVLALDGTCPGGGDPIDDAGRVCPNLYETTAAGAVMLGLGTAVMTTGMVLLSIDEIQTRRGRQHQAMLHWVMRF